MELIVINTPDSTHYEYAKAALLAGKHVVIEKPITSNADQAKG
ncbi:MAG: Gfo/Idh/MocA family oxidoreductase [Bacteroides graminisolvens]